MNSPKRIQQTEMSVMHDLRHLTTRKLTKVHDGFISQFVLCKSDWIKSFLLAFDKKIDENFNFQLKIENLKLVWNAHLR